MNKAGIRKLLEQGEGLQVEFKTARKWSNRDLYGPIDPDRFSPYPKNPVIARMFKEIGLADELGSGVRKLFKYCMAYGGHDPELVENDIFNVHISLPVESAEQVEKTSEKTSVKTSVKTSGEMPATA